MHLVSFEFAISSFKLCPRLHFFLVPGVLDNVIVNQVKKRKGALWPAQSQIC